MSLNKKISDTSVRIGDVRFSYANVFKPRASEEGKDEKYSVCILIPKTNKAGIKLLEDAIEAAKQAGKASKWGGKIPGKLNSPLRDGDEEREDDPNYEGCYFLNCSSKNKPGIRVWDGSSVVEALDDEDFYSGCYGAVTLNFFPYDTSGNKGVGAGLNNLLKTKDGPRLAGGRSADEDFGDVADELGSELD
ncbi:MAG: DUF2815 family protein [Clostridia bacterium]|nr:DUF2815 family protein [Clostridia bacterium]